MNPRRGVPIILALIILIISCTTRYQRHLPPPGGEPESRIRGVLLEPVGDEPAATVNFDGADEVILTDSGVVAVYPVADSSFYPRETIDRVIHQRFSPVKTFVLLPLALLGGVAVVALASSCPIVYAYDGEHYRAVAEPLGGAVTAGLARTDLSELESLRPIVGEYRIILANELEETQHIDAFSLLVADHPEGSSVVADRSGRLLRVQDPRPVRSALVSGKDISPLVRRVDGQEWAPPADATVLDGGALRDTLLVEFDRPAEDHAVLLVHAGTSEQGAATLKEMLELWGEQVSTWYALLDTSPEARSAHEAWVLREELWALKVWVEEETGWRAQDVIVGGGPIITETQGITLDLTGVSGPVVRIRVEPPRGYWAIDYLALHTGSPMEAGVREVQASYARYGDRDMRSELEAIDGEELHLPIRGEWVELSFPAPPPPPPGLARTVFARTHGYYRIHLDARGPRQASALDSLWFFPGHPVRFAARRSGEARRNAAVR